MQGSTNGVSQEIKNVSTDCVSNHCMIHRQALVRKKLKRRTNQGGDLAYIIE